MAAGEAVDRAEQKANESYDAMVAPPCVACGEPVADKDYERHRYEKHAGNEMLQPSGTPDAREALFLAHDAEELRRKFAIWRARHPGLRLQLAAEGTRYEGRMVFVKYRILDSRGRGVR
jgi:hypothetical protein